MIAHSFYEGLGPFCEPSHLSLFLPPFADPRVVLEDQDVVYVGGGNTVNMLAVWRVHAVDTLLRDALQPAQCCTAAAPAGCVGSSRE